MLSKYIEFVKAHIELLNIKIKELSGDDYLQQRVLRDKEIWISLLSYLNDRLQVVLLIEFVKELDEGNNHFQK